LPAIVVAEVHLRQAELEVVIAERELEVALM
jgi:hypothetical protein